MFNWNDTSGADAIGGLLRDLEEGYSQRLTIVVPPGPGGPFPPTSWPCSSPSDARGMGMNPEITLVTPEQAPLAIFGARAVERHQRARAAGVHIELGAYAELDPGPPTAIVMRPSGRRLEGGRILALPRLRGRTPRGIPADPDGFVTVDAHGRVVGVDTSGPRATASTSRSSSAAWPPSRPTPPPPTSLPTRAQTSSARRSARSCAGGC